MKKQISSLFGSPYKDVPLREFNRLTRPTAPPSFMFPKTSPKSVDDFELGMEDIRLDLFHDDHLPSPEEVETYGLTPPTPLVRRRWFRWTCVGAILFLSILLVIVVVSMAPKKNKHTDDADKSNDSVEEPEDFLLVDSRLHDTISFLLDDVNHKDLTNTSSPQFLAAQWMAEVDGLRAPLVQESGFMERYALVVLWFAILGEEWQHSLGFLTGVHHCEWHSTFQRGDMSVFEMGVQCDERANVKSIILRK
jgi:hypothetical protein